MAFCGRGSPFAILYDVFTPPDELDRQLVDFEFFVVEVVRHGLELADVAICFTCLRRVEQEQEQEREQELGW